MCRATQGRNAGGSVRAAHAPRLGHGGVLAVAQPRFFFVAAFEPALAAFLGAVLGAFSVNGLKTWLTSAAPDLWLFVLGALFVAVTMFLPRGLAGLLKGGGR